MHLTHLSCQESLSLYSFLISSRAYYKKKKLISSTSSLACLCEARLAIKASSTLRPQMAHSCVYTSASTIRSLVFPPSSTNPSSRYDPQNLSIPFKYRSRDLRRSVSRGRKSFTTKAVYSDTNSRKGIWSIRDDLVLPSSVYFPTYAQGQDPVVQERLMTAVSHLFQHRIIRCGGGVDDDMANFIVAQLLYLDGVDPTKDIIMYINSPGGSVTAGMAIYDTMRHIRSDVSTVCVGLAASMGAFLLSGGTKGKRFSLPNSRIMIHQPLGGAQGSQSEIEIQADEMAHHKANLSGHLAHHTGHPVEKIYRDTDRDYFMSPKEAKDYGLIDGVIMNPMKAFPPLPATTS